jgi:RnfABCDGE-type electron transport complex G subunit
MFLGTAPGVIGGSVIAIIAGGLILWAMDIIHGQIWISVLVGFTVFIGLFGGQGFDPKFLAAHLCGGGVMLGAFFMATDYVTSPVSRLGQTVYGLFIGILGAMFRCFGTAADSFSYSIIIANLFVPLIDRFVISKPYAFRKRAIEIQRGIDKPPLFKRIPRPVIVLTAIALLAGLALSGVYMLTKDSIEQQMAEKKMQAYRTVLSGAETFEKIEAVSAYENQVYGTKFGRVFINEAVVGKDGEGKLAGYAISVTSSEGYDGNVTISVGLTEAGKITSVSFTELHETPGKGMLAADDAFIGQFNGRKAESFKLLKDGGSQTDDEIDGVSGATVTSKAVVNAVNAAMDFYYNVMGGGRNE